jgi:phosphatidylglycerol:prolipoprotein diacylglycerol transferase
MYPEILSWGPFHIRSYGLALAVAFLVGTWLSLREARRKGLDEDAIVYVILVALVASIIGARLLYVLEHIAEYRRSWGSVLAVWQGGLTLYGGVAAGTVAGLWMARRSRLPVWATADAVAPSIALGTAFGRVGCFLNGCCYGHPTDLPWGVVYPPDSFPGIEFGAQPIHPSQLYASLAGLVLFGILWAIRKRLTVNGHLFWIFIVVFAVLRILLDFTRAFEPGAVVGKIGPMDVSESQFISLAMVMFGLLMIGRLSERAKQTQRAIEPATPA